MVKSEKAQTEATTTLPIAPAVMQIGMDIMVENTRFLTERLHEDLETQKAILACKTSAEVMHVQSEFFRKAMGQYTDHAKHLGERFAAVAAASMKTMTSKQSRAYDDVPL